MTEKEFERYQTAAQLKEKINTLEKDIEYIDDHFDELVYPRSESGWCLAISINDNYKTLHLSSKLFWECIDFVKQRKLEELKEYKEQFDKL